MPSSTPSSETDLWRPLALHGDPEILSAFYEAVLDTYPWDELDGSGEGIPAIAIMAHDVVGCFERTANGGFGQYFLMSVPHERVYVSFDQVGLTLAGRMLQRGRTMIEVSENSFEIKTGEEEAYRNLLIAFYEQELDIQNALVAKIRRALCSESECPANLRESFAARLGRPPAAPCNCGLFGHRTGAT